ncbi:MAG: bifunctional riboflavin kinase/FAD synthetase [Candidatus Edwardsbacteria bacterium]
MATMREMKIIRGCQKPPQNYYHSIATFGSFDGVHLGHQAIIKEVIRQARLTGKPSLVVTFEPHPQEIISPQKAPKLLTTLEEKQEILSNLGIDLLLFLPFDRKLSQTSPSVFVKDIFIEYLRVKEIVCGSECGFGRDRKGNLSVLKKLGEKFGFSVDAAPPALVNGAKVSSTRIRQAIIKGNIKLANRMLGRPYSLSGRVIKGEGIGKKLGYPTANISLNSPKKLVPPDGVYAVKVGLKNQSKKQKAKSKKIHSGMMYIGHKPTYYPNAKCKMQNAKFLEIHIFDFEGNLLGKELKIFFIDRLREEKRFKDENALVRQIKKDEEKAKRLLSYKEMFTPTCPGILSGQVGIKRNENPPQSPFFKGGGRGDLKSEIINA